MTNAYIFTAFEAQYLRNNEKRNAKRSRVIAQAKRRTRRSVRETLAEYRTSNNR